jgi:cytoskeletal protein RodZ
MSYETKDIKLLKKIGARLREIRLEKGWTLEETEEHSWPNWRHLQKIETGNKNITVITLRKLAEL